MINKKEFMLETARRFSSFSKDPSTKVGAIAVDENFRVLSIGYNGLPSKFPDNYESLSREEKNLITIHAEVNCILNAAKNGVSLQNSTMFISEPPCSNCAAALINAGVKKIVTPEGTTLSQTFWGKSLELSKKILETCNVEHEKL